MVRCIAQKFVCAKDSVQVLSHAMIADAKRTPSKGKLDQIVANFIKLYVLPTGHMILIY